MTELEVFLMQLAGVGLVVLMFALDVWCRYYRR